MSILTSDNYLFVSYSSSVFSFNAVHLDSIPCDLFFKRTPAFCEALSEQIEGTDGDGQEDVENVETMQGLFLIFLCAYVPACAVSSCWHSTL